MSNVKTIAIYLPQFHPIKENNEWWGEGFTEWTNVKKATPLFKQHYQPHIPENENYYDLSFNNPLMQQAKLAKEHGIFGFCFYHYWFNEKLLLETPLHNFLHSKEPDIPFCLSWANENWTRTWDGQSKKVLMEQKYSLEDDRKHIQYLIPFFRDSRYIKIDNKPVFIMYRSELHPQIEEATKIWREEVKKAGFDDLYLIRTEHFKKNIDPKTHGFDAGMEFAPDNDYRGEKIAKSNKTVYLLKKALHKINLKKFPEIENGIFSYPQLANNMIAKPKRNYKYFRCVTPMWDNSARRKSKAAIYINSTPEIFGNWIEKMKTFTEENFEPKEQLLFINAWNEWGEGCHLEPDIKWGKAYLKSLKDMI